MITNVKKKCLFLYMLLGSTSNTSSMRKATSTSSSGNKQSLPIRKFPIIEGTSKEKSTFNINELKETLDSFRKNYTQLYMNLQNIDLFIKDSKKYMQEGGIVFLHSPTNFEKKNILLDILDKYYLDGYGYSFDSILVPTFEGQTSVEKNYLILTIGKNENFKANKYLYYCLQYKNNPLYVYFIHMYRKAIANIKKVLPAEENFIEYPFNNYVATCSSKSDIKFLQEAVKLDRIKDTPSAFLSTSHHDSSLLKERVHRDDYKEIYKKQIENHLATIKENCTNLNVIITGIYELKKANEILQHKILEQKAQIQNYISIGEKNQMEAIRHQVNNQIECIFSEINPILQALDLNEDEKKDIENFLKFDIGNPLRQKKIQSMFLEETIIENIITKNHSASVLEEGSNIVKKTNSKKETETIVIMEEADSKDKDTKVAIITFSQGKDKSIEVITTSKGEYENLLLKKTLSAPLISTNITATNMRGKNILQISRENINSLLIPSSIRIVINPKLMAEFNSKTFNIGTINSLSSISLLKQICQLSSLAKFQQLMNSNTPTTEEETIIKTEEETISYEAPAPLPAVETIKDVKDDIINPVKLQLPPMEMVKFHTFNFEIQNSNSFESLERDSYPFQPQISASFEKPTEVFSYSTTNSLSPLVELSEKLYNVNSTQIITETDNCKSINFLDVISNSDDVQISKMPEESILPYITKKNFQEPKRFALNEQLTRKNPVIVSSNYQKELENSNPSINIREKITSSETLNSFKERRKNSYLQTPEAPKENPVKTTYSIKKLESVLTSNEFQTPKMPEKPTFSYITKKDFQQATGIIFNKESKNMKPNMNPIRENNNYQRKLQNPNISNIREKITFQENLTDFKRKEKNSYFQIPKIKEKTGIITSYESPEYLSLSDKFETFRVPPVKNIPLLVKFERILSETSTDISLQPSVENNINLSTKSMKSSENILSGLKTKPILSFSNPMVAKTYSLPPLYKSLSQNEETFQEEIPLTLDRINKENISPSILEESLFEILAEECILQQHLPIDISKIVDYPIKKQEELKLIENISTKEFFPREYSEDLFYTTIDEYKQEKIDDNGELPEGPLLSPFTRNYFINQEETPPKFSTNEKVLPVEELVEMTELNNNENLFDNSTLPVKDNTPMKLLEDKQPQVFLGENISHSIIHNHISKNKKNPTNASCDNKIFKFVHMSKKLKKKSYNKENHIPAINNKKPTKNNISDDINIYNDTSTIENSNSKNLLTMAGVGLALSLAVISPEADEDMNSHLE
jgi:hypothetical protein